MNKKVLLNAAVLGLFAAGALGMAPASAIAADKCFGVNKCKGAGACGGKGHSCAGNNGCAGQGYLKIDKDTCLKIKGGSLTPVAGKSDMKDMKSKKKS